MNGKVPAVAIFAMIGCGMVRADTIPIAFPALTTNLTATLHIQTTGSNSINTGQSGFTAGDPLTLTGIYTVSGYLPLGDTITGAVLELPLVIGSATPTGAPNWLTFNAALGSGTFTIASTLNTANNVPLASLTSYDLFANGFGADVTAGHDIKITFTITDNLTPNWNTYPGTPLYPNPGTNFSVGDSRTVNGTFQLVLTTTATPEPFTPVLVGAGLVAIGFVRRRKPI